MAVGTLSTQSLTATTLTTVYTVPASALYADVSIHVLNRNTSLAAVRIAVTKAGSPSIQEYIEYGVEIPENGGSLEISRLQLAPAEKLMIWSSVNDVNVRVGGIEHTRISA